MGARSSPRATAARNGAEPLLPRSLPRAPCASPFPRYHAVLRRLRRRSGVYIGRGIFVFHLGGRNLNVRGARRGALLLVSLTVLAAGVLLASVSPVHASRQSADRPVPIDAKVLRQLERSGKATFWVFLRP